MRWDKPKYMKINTKSFIITIVLLLTAVMGAFVIAEKKADADETHIQSTSKPTVVVLLGAPGSGKGTQAVKLAKKLNLPHISTGDILRENVKKQTDLGKEAKGFMDSGKLVPDTVVSQMLLARINEPDSKNGYILDGFPRTLSQANDLDKHLGDKVNVIVINLDVPDAKLLERINKRASEKADKRSDDDPQVAAQRLKVYHEQTEPVIGFYKKKGVLINIDGEEKPREVFKAIMSAYKKQTHN